MNIHFYVIANFSNKLFFSSENKISKNRTTITWTRHPVSSYRFKTFSQASSKATYLSKRKGTKYQVFEVIHTDSQFLIDWSVPV